MAKVRVGLVGCGFVSELHMYAYKRVYGLEAEVKAVAARGHDVRVECLIEGKLFELEARGPGIPSGVAPGLSLRIKPLRPNVYAAAAAG